jgi:hypothetical protein
MKNSIRISILMVIAILSTSNLFAATRTWSGATNTVFATATNWVGGTAPANGDDVVIPAGLTNYPTLGANTPTLLSITINGGTLTQPSTGNRNISATTITVNSGGTLVRGSGNLTATTINLNGGTIDLANRTISTLTYNSGTLTITNGATVTTFNMASNSYTNGSINLNITTLNVNGGTFTRGSGTLTMTNLTLNGGTYDNGSSNLSLSGNFTQETGTFTHGAYNLTVSNNFILNGGTFTAGSGTISANVYDINNGTFNIKGNKITTGNDFNIDGATVNVSDADLNIGNDLFVISGTLDLNGYNLTVVDDYTYNGGSIIDAGSLITAANVIWNFTGFTHTLPTNLYATATMTFTSGIVVSSNSALVRFAYNTTISGVSNTSHIDGPVRKEISSSNTTPTFVFPIGNGTYYAPLTLSSYGSRRNEDYFTAQYFDARNSNAGGTKGTGLSLVSQAEYWILDRGASTGTATTTAVVGLSYNTSRSGSITDAALLKVARWNGSQWADHGRATGSSTSNTSGTLTSSAAVTSFSPFTIGSSSNVNPLPVHLLNFTAVPVASNVNVKWTTTSEINNDYFNVEKSLDGKNWSVIGQVKGAGNTEALTNYNFVDANPVMGMQYYRLQQTDINGMYTYSAVAPVNFSATLTSTLNIFPMPANNFLNVELPGASEMNVTIYNANGQKVFEATSGSLLNIDIQNLNAGLYIVEVKADNNVSSAKFLKN